VIAVWNLASPEQAVGMQTAGSKTIHLRFEHLPRSGRAYISRVDRDHGDAHPAYEKMGQPRFPTREQIQVLQKAPRLSPPEIRELKNGELTLDLPPDGLAVVTVK